MLSKRQSSRVPNLVLIATLLMSLLASAGMAQDWKGRARIQGTVLDQDDKPIGGAVVTLTLRGRGPEPVTTNSKGKWSYLGLTGGAWDVTIEAPGYETSEGTLPISQAIANKPLTKRLYLLGSGSSSAAVDPALAAANAAAQAASDALSRAGQLIDAGQRAEGRKLLEEVVGTLDTNRQGSIYLAIAQTHLEEENTAAAIASMEQGLSVDPNHVKTLSLLSSILINEGRSEEAQQFIDRMPEGTKIDPTALLNQGIAKYNQGDIAGALLDFEPIVADYPELPEPYYYRGLCYLATGKNEEAKADFAKLLELAPDHPKAAETKEFLKYL